MTAGKECATTLSLDSFESFAIGVEALTKSVEAFPS